MEKTTREEIDETIFDSKNNKRVHNPKVNAKKGHVVYCTEEYAQSLYDLYEDHSYNIPGGFKSKDLVDGQAYVCKINSVDEKHGYASTESGQTLYIEIEKELKDIKRLGLQGISFTPGLEIVLVARKVNSTYYGSAVDYYVESLRAELFEQIKDEKSAYLAKIKSVNKGGYLVDVSGVECFLPGSLAAANKITDFDSYIGKSIYVMVESYLESKDIFIVSYKKYLEKIMEQKIQELDLTKKYKGSVTGTSKFGVFIEWEEVYTGLLHKTELPENSELRAFSPGDEVEFYIKEIKDNKRVNLTLEEPLEKTIKLYSIKEKIESEDSLPFFTGLLKHKRKNGALIEIPELDSMAFVPHDKFNRDTKKLNPGDPLDVEIYEVDVLAGKIYAKALNE